jgi:hypothetical protein
MGHDTHPCIKTWFQTSEHFTHQALIFNYLPEVPELFEDKHECTENPTILSSNGLKTKT